MVNKRVEGLVEQQAGAETLLYDEATHKAYCLNATASVVWSMCDGQHSVAEMASKATITLQHPVTDELVLFTLAELRKDGLLLAEAGVVAPAQHSRREIMQKIGIGALTMLPVIAILSAPKPAHATSVCVDCTVQDTVKAPSLLKRR